MPYRHLCERAHLEGRIPRCQIRFQGSAWNDFCGIAFRPEFLVVLCLFTDVSVAYGILLSVIQTRREGQIGLRKTAIKIEMVLNILIASSEKKRKREKEQRKYLMMEMVFLACGTMPPTERSGRGVLCAW